MIIPLTITERLLHQLHHLPVPILDSFAGVLFGRSLAIALRRGLFEAVADRSLTAAELAEKTGLSQKGITLLAESFVVGGYLRREGTRYVANAVAMKWLVRRSPVYLGNFIRYVETLYTRWHSLEYSLEQGKPRQPYTEAFTDADWEVYVHGMQDLAGLLLADVIPRIALRHNACRLVDLGGSHGLYSTKCCERYPALEAIVVDYPEALKNTARIIHDKGMEGRVSLLGGDFRTMVLPADADGVLMFNIIHGLTEEENRSLIRNAVEALRPGGKLYILDQLQGRQGGSRLQQFIPLMVGLNLLNEIGGTSYRVEDVTSWCAGMRSVRRMKLRLPGVTLIEATK
jgi:hypothetical protein